MGCCQSTKSRTSEQIKHELSLKYDNFKYNSAMSVLESPIKTLLMYRYLFSISKDFFNNMYGMEHVFTSYIRLIAIKYRFNELDSMKSFRYIEVKTFGELKIKLTECLNLLKQIFDTDDDSVYIDFLQKTSTEDFSEFEKIYNFKQLYIELTNL